MVAGVAFDGLTFAATSAAGERRATEVRATAGVTTARGLVAGGGSTTDRKSVV